MKQNVSPGKRGRLISNLLFFLGCGGTTEKKVKLLLSFLFHIHGKKEHFLLSPLSFLPPIAATFLYGKWECVRDLSFFPGGCMGAERPLDYVLRAERDPRWGPWTPKRRFFCSRNYAEKWCVNWEVGRWGLYTLTPVEREKEVWKSGFRPEKHQFSESGGDKF